MPDPEKILRLLDRAVALCRKTPGRVGRLIRLVNSDSVLVVGDLHGNVDHFQKAYRAADLENHPRRHLVLQEVIHGPFQYDDGSDKSHQLMDLVAAAMVQFPGRVHFLPGNHEISQRMERQIAKESGELNSLFRAGVNFAYGERADDVYQWYKRLIDSVPLALKTSNRVFISHSLPAIGKIWNPEILTAQVTSTEDLSPGGSAYHMVWGRDTSVEAAARFLKSVDADLLVTGHIPCPDGFEVPNNRQVVLDCQQPPGAYCLFPADRPITHADLVAGISLV